MSTTFTPRTSYAEDRFLSFWHKLHIPYSLYRQFQVGPYYVDFACLEGNLIIEIDGAAYHSSPDQQERDTYRQRYIEADGWTVIRFTAKDVYHWPVKCVRRAQSLIEQQ